MDECRKWDIITTLYMCPEFFGQASNPKRWFRVLLRWAKSSGTRKRDHQTGTTKNQTILIANPRRTEAQINAGPTFSRIYIPFGLTWGQFCSSKRGCKLNNPSLLYDSSHLLDELLPVRANNGFLIYLLLLHERIAEMILQHLDKCSGVLVRGKRRRAAQSRVIVTLHKKVSPSQATKQVIRGNLANGWEN